MSSVEAASVDTRHPELQWAHNETQVFIKVIIPEAQKIVLHPELHKLHFSAKSYDETIFYDFSIELFGEIIPDSVKYRKLTKHVRSDLLMSLSPSPLFCL